MIGKEEIAAMIPHAGASVLIDTLADHNDHGVVALTSSHRDTANPLRRDGRLGAAAVVEMSAQVMAAHRALAAGPHMSQRRGFVASVKRLTLHTPTLHQYEDDLAIRVTLRSSSDEMSIYLFAVTAGKEKVGEGELLVVTPHAEGGS